jgi:hypothetical protein
VHQLVSSAIILTGQLSEDEIDDMEFDYDEAKERLVASREAAAKETTKKDVAEESK